MIVRQTLTIYFAIWCAGIILAAAAILWLGPDAHVPVDFTLDGAPIESRSLAVLWFAPALLSILYGTLGLAAWIENRRREPGIELGEDARRGLFRYALAVRRTMIGFGLLLLFTEGLAIMRAAGMNAPFGLGREGMVRLFYLVAGLLFAYLGNITPKLPYVRRRGASAARFHQTNRFVGWVIMIGGLGYLWALARSRPQEPIA